MSKTKNEILKELARTTKDDTVRIRKFTPRECFRLMDVDEEDIDKLLASGLPNTALYKLAGNSIVVSCMSHIFENLLKNEQ